MQQAALDLSDARRLVVKLPFHLRSPTDTAKLFDHICAEGAGDVRVLMIPRYVCLREESVRFCRTISMSVRERF